MNSIQLTGPLPLLDQEGARGPRKFTKQEVKAVQKMARDQGKSVLKQVASGTGSGKRMLALVKDTINQRLNQMLPGEGTCISAEDHPVSRNHNVLALICT